MFIGHALPGTIVWVATSAGRAAIGVMLGIRPRQLASVRAAGESCWPDEGPPAIWSARHKPHAPWHTEYCRLLLLNCENTMRISSRSSSDCGPSTGSLSATRGLPDSAHYLVVGSVFTQECYGRLAHQLEEEWSWTAF